MYTCFSLAVRKPLIISALALLEVMLEMGTPAHLVALVRELESLDTFFPTNFELDPKSELQTIRFLMLINNLALILNFKKLLGGIKSHFGAKMHHY